MELKKAQHVAVWSNEVQNIKLLSIGNSFSQDAQRYLHQLALADGADIKCVNLYIGGCSLERHYQNLLEDAPAYDYELNGEKTGNKSSIHEALMSDSWDVVTLQQVSTKSPYYDTYLPYVEELAVYVRRCCPGAKIFLHETWAYEAGSDRLAALLDFATPAEMLSAAKASYLKAARTVSADGIIPSGTAMLRATELGVEKIHRDTFHASLGVGRYLLALCWYKMLTGADISANAFGELDEPVTDEERRIAIDAVNFAFEKK